MLRINEIIYRASSIIWIKEKHNDYLTTHEGFVKNSTKKQISESSHFIIKRNKLLNHFLWSFTSISKSVSSSSTTRINTSIIIFASFQISSALKRHLEFRYRFDFSNSLNLLILKCMKNVIDFSQILESRSYKKIMKNLDCHKWIIVMKNENISLLINKTWTLINIFKNKRILRDKWVYKIKKEKRDEILRYKARWVIRDFE
jgi:hypothetical protein